MKSATQQKFDRAEKRAMRLIAERAMDTGDRAAATRAVEKLYELIRNPEIRGEVDHESYTVRADVAHRARVAAEETGAVVRGAALDSACAALRKAAREDVPLPGSYEAELYLMRGC